MFIIKLKRVFYLGILNVVRNPLVSFSVIFVMAVTLFIVGSSLLFGRVVDDVIVNLRDKVDVTVYFVAGTEESQIFEFREKLGGLQQVKEVVYVSQLAALEEYKKRHENDPRLIEGLNILEENPFRARFSIRAQQTSDFETITKFLENEDVLSDNPTTIIDKIDYYQNREIINRLTSVVDTANFFTQLIINLLIFISFLIVFNIVRLIIYLSKEEISVMRLIGADGWYVRAPFLISAGFYGFLGAIVATILLYPVSYVISPSVERFFGGEGLFAYYVAEFFVLFLLLSIIGIAVGVISAFFSTTRYLD